MTNELLYHTSMIKTRSFFPYAEAQIKYRDSPRETGLLELISRFISSYYAYAALALRLHYIKLHVILALSMYVSCQAYKMGKLNSKYTCSVVQSGSVGCIAFVNTHIVTKSVVQQSYDYYSVLPIRSYNSVSSLPA